VATVVIVCAVLRAFGFGYHTPANVHVGRAPHIQLERTRVPVLRMRPIPNASSDILHNASLAKARLDQSSRGGRGSTVNRPPIGLTRVDTFRSCSRCTASRWCTTALHALRPTSPMIDPDVLAELARDIRKYWVRTSDRQCSATPLSPRTRSRSA
jgi:hypothetical protein